jgi:predicted nucleic acid-binding protein
MLPSRSDGQCFHVLRGAETRHLIGESTTVEFITRLNQLPIKIDVCSPQDTQLGIASLSREFNLSDHDAHYLELAVRLGLPIASLDKDLIKSPKKKAVNLYSGGHASNATAT